MPRNGVDYDSEDSLAIRAAWLHYAGGLTQSAVAKRLGVANLKAHRLITRANQAGAIKVTIDGDILECVALEDRLSERFGLSFCEVAPDLYEDGLPVRALGMAGATYLRRVLKGGAYDVIGLGHGRTMAAMVHELPRIETNGIEFVSLLGGLTRNYAANPHDVMHRMADKTGATAYVMPVPFFANTVEDRKVLLSQRGVREVFDLAARAPVKFVGIGAIHPQASTIASRMIEPAEVEDVQTCGGVGEVLGHFFNAQGAAIETDLSARTLSVGLADLQTTEIVAVAGGAEKIEAIRSVLKSGYINGLITDERTAQALVTDD